MEEIRRGRDWIQVRNGAPLLLFSMNAMRLSIRTTFSPPVLYMAATGCRYVASGPLVRSSYKAGEFYIAAMVNRDRGITSRHATVVS